MTNNHKSQPRENQFLKHQNQPSNSHHSGEDVHDTHNSHDKTQPDTNSAEPCRYQFTHFDKKHIPELMEWFTSAHDVIFWSGFKFKYPFTTESFIAQLKLRFISAYSLLSEDTQQLLGFGQLMFDQGRCHLVRVAINPAFRQQGHGKMLLKSLCYQGYKRFNSEVFTLFVNKSNTAAVRLYQQYGFEISEYDDGPMPNDQSWYMVRKLYRSQRR